MDVEFPRSVGLIERDPFTLEGYSADAINRVQPGALARPRSVEELQNLLVFCNQRRLGITICGNRTSLTGAALSCGGLLVSMEAMPQSWRLRPDPDFPGRWLVDAGPAVVLGRLQTELAAKGFFYPPDPTSRHEILLGSTIATNASGEDSYHYGPTRRWVRGLTYLRADGTKVRLERKPHERIDTTKNTCGYPIRDSEIDLLIGSEGTLGIVVEATLEVLPNVPEFFSIFFFLPSESSALEQARFLHESPDFDPRCLEYFDEAALRIIGEKKIDIPAEAKAALYVKQEYQGDPDEKMSAWYGYLERTYRTLGDASLLDYVHFAGDAHTQEEIRRWRHHVPARVNERAACYRERGGGKVGTDWYVPVPALVDMFRRVRQDQGDMDWVVFGHIGNGHPHFNFIARDGDEYGQARDLLLKHCRWAVELGGGVSGEHGLGKLKAHLLRIQYSRDEIEEMVKIKRRMDPHGILGPGNIFEAGVLA